MSTKCALLPGEKCLSDWVEVRGSGIHGRGVFAKKRIPKDTQIIEYVGELIDKDESNERGWAQMELHQKTGEAAVYIFNLNDDWDVDGNSPLNSARLINHGCDHNCEAYIDNDEIWIWSVKTIAKDEELLFNYGFDLENWEDHPCICGADCCPGYIAGRDYWPELEEKKAEKAAAESEETRPVSVK